MSINERIPLWPNRYGDDDVVGAANEITSEKVIQAVRLVNKGERLVLARVLADDSPTQMWRYWKHHMTLNSVLPENYIGINAQSYVEEAVSGALHSGTHLDALGHIGIGEFAYNGSKYSTIVSGQGLLKLGIENVPPIVTRGVLLDIAALHGMPVLSDGYCVTADDLMGAETKAGIKISSGDAVLIHTGWGRFWEEDPKRYASGEPGISLEGARWLSERRVSLIGADNWAVEVVPGLIDEGSFPVHQHCITLYGQYLLENVDTEPLVKSGVSEFCFMVTAPRLKGASGVPVAPIAII